MTSQLKISNTELDGVTYTPRTNSLNSFYAKALKLQREYAKYEYVYVEEDIAKRVTDKNTEDYDYFFEELVKQKYLCRELFLTTDIEGNPSTANAELLNDIMLNEKIDHAKERNESEYMSYLEFMMGLLTDFFTKFNPLRHLSSQLMRLSKDIKSETK